MIDHTFILAERDPVFTGIVIVMALIFWGISALSKAAKGAAERQKQRLRQVRDSIQSGGEMAQRQQWQPPRAPVQLAPEIARRVPPAFPQRQLPKRKQSKAQRRATNYNAMAAPKPPPIPVLEEADKPSHHEGLATAPSIPSPSSTRPPVTAGAVAIHRWLNPKTLRQQFILTELLQPPLALREDRI